MPACTGPEKRADTWIRPYLKRFWGGTLCSFVNAPVFDCTAALTRTVLNGYNRAIMTTHKSAAAVSGSAVLLLTLIVAVALTLAIALSVLPAAPGAPTPTWPSGIDLPDKLPRVQ